MSTAVTTKKDTSLKGILTSDAMKKQFALALPKHLDADRFCRIAITALTRTPKLQGCTQESFFGCLLDLSALGLEPDNRRAYLIPYGNKCTLVIGYQGLVELVLRSGQVSTIHCDVVCENDEFEVNFGRIVRHVPNYKGDRGEAYAAYAHIVMKDGGIKDEIMSKSEIEAVRSGSQGKNAEPWVKHWNEMAKKTVFRRCAKWLPLSAELRNQIEKDDDQFAARPERQVESVDIFGDGTAAAETSAETEIDHSHDDLREALSANGIEVIDFIAWCNENGHAKDAKDIGDLSSAKAKQLTANIAKVKAAIQP